MYVYVLTFALSMLTAHMIKRVRNLNVWIKALISALPVVLITGLRYDVGSDFFSYKAAYLGIRSDYTEYIFIQLSKLIAKISNYNYQVFIFVTSLLFVYVLYLAIWHLSDNVEYSILLFMISTMYFGGMNAIRQGIAISISLYALRFIVEAPIGTARENKLKFRSMISEKKKNIVKFLICIIIATMIHDTLFMCAAFLIFKKIQMNVSKAVIAVALVYIFNDIIYGLVGYLLKTFSAKHYGSFINTAAVDVAEVNIIIVMTAFIFATYIKKKYHTDETFNLYYVIMFLSIILGIFTTWLPWGKRLMWNYMFICIFLIPKSICYIRYQKNRLVAYSFFAMLYFVLTYYSIVINGTHGCIPYNWIL